MRYTIALIALTALYSCRTQSVTKEVKVTVHDTIYVDCSTVDTIIEPCKDSVVVVENERVIVKFERLPGGKAKLSGTAKADTSRYTVNVEQSFRRWIAAHWSAACSVSNTPQ